MTGPQLLEGVGGKEGVNFSGGGCNFYIENKVKSEKINDKKSYNYRQGGRGDCLKREGLDSL